MEQLLDLILSGGMRLPLFTGELLALEREMPKSEWLSLLMLQRRGEATMSELAADLGAPLSTATGIGARLERRKLVQRERHPRDRRIVLMRLTPKGQTLAARARGHLDSLLHKVQAALTPAETQQLLTLMQKVLAALHSPAERKEGFEDTRARQIPIEE